MRKIAFYFAQGLLFLIPITATIYVLYALFQRVDQIFRFNIPGLGRLAVSGIITHDYPYVQGVILVMVTAVLIINLAIDLAYGWLDPRVRYG